MITILSQVAYTLLILLIVPIPIGTDKRTRRFPYVTYALILANALVYLTLCAPALANRTDGDLFSHWGVIPRFPNVICLFTSMFLHVSVEHLLWNMVFLWLFGPDGEDALGHLPYLIFYFAGGIAAGLMHLAIVMLFADNASVAYAPLVGASGAVSAVIGLYAVRFYRSQLRFYWVAGAFLDTNWGFLRVPALAGLGLWFLQNLIGGVLALFQPDRNGIAYWAHIGGFVFGIVAAELTDMVGEAMREYMFTEAHSAVSKGDRGVRDAARKYRLLLLRRPNDSEVKDALASLSEERTMSGAVPEQQVNSSVVDAYVALLETSLINRDQAQTEQWEKEIQRLGGLNVLGEKSVIRLASRYARAGDHKKAANLYRSFSSNYPDSLESERAALDAAVIYLDELDQPENAIGLLKPMIEFGDQRRRLPFTLKIVAYYRRLTAVVGERLGLPEPASDLSD